MAMSASEILGVLRAYGIVPRVEGVPRRDGPPEPGIDLPGIDLPGIGELGPGEAVYATSLGNVLGEADEDLGTALSDDDEWAREIEEIIEAGRSGRALPRPRYDQREPPEPHCAWYCPIHYFYRWGIYIRQDCIKSHVRDIARFVDWPAVRQPAWKSRLQLERSAFYVFFLHEQFHHKVESLGFRVLIATASDRYRPYKANVYRPTFLTPDCLEESLANADSYRRLDEPRHTRRVAKPIREGLRAFLRASFAAQPPGYREALRYLADGSYRGGLHKLQSQMLDGKPAPGTPANHWSIAPNMITALMDITDEIYVVLPTGGRPLFRPSAIDPGATASARGVACSRAAR